MCDWLYGQNDDYVSGSPSKQKLVDDMICLQNSSCMSELTDIGWHMWLESSRPGLDFIKDSGRFIDKSLPLNCWHEVAADGAADAGAGSSVIVVNGKNVKFERLTRGSKSEGGIGLKSVEMDYTVLRLDVLAPALFRFCGQSPPVLNVGSGVRPSLLYTDERNKMPRVRSSGMTFNNVARYLTIKAPPAIVAGINLEPVTRGRGFEDVWTLSFSFCHPIPSKFKRCLLYKRGSLEIEIESRQEMSATPSFIDENMVVRLFDGKTGDRMLNVSSCIRSGMKDEVAWTYTIDGENVQWLPMDYTNVHNVVICKYPNQCIRIILDGTTKFIGKSPMSDAFDSMLLQPSPSAFLLLGHRVK